MGVGSFLVGLLVAWAAVVPAAAQTARSVAVSPLPVQEKLDGLGYTIVSTPPAERVPLPALKLDKNVFAGTVQPFPDRAIPPLFWYENEGVRYGVAYQNRKAPLLVAIAGTGASFNSGLNKGLASAALAAGMHFLGLPSPTHINFIINGSKSNVPGRMPDDAADLYRTIELALAQVRGKIDISEIYLTGYSLGAMNAAYVAKLDDERRTIGFKKVLMLNPPVSLWNSVQILDGMYDRNVPKDAAGRTAVINKIFNAFGRVYTREEGPNLDENFLYAAYEELEPTTAGKETLIGMSFRVSSSNLIFASDYMTRTGYIVSPDAEFTATTSLTNVGIYATTKTFADYLDGVLVPHYRKTDPGLTRERIIAEESLRPIESYLRGSAKIGLITNRDDIILAPGEVDYLANLFGARATIFADGGHCGNYRRRDFLDAFNKFFAG